MELKIINPNEDGFLKKIEWNFEEIKSEVAAKIEEYKTLVYNDDNIKIAKTDIATLRKFYKALDDKRKDIKKKCLEPYECFEKEMKEVLGLVNEPILLIDKQIKEVEEIKKQEKRNKIKEFYEENIGSLKQLLPLESIFKAEYMNVTKPMKSIQEEIKAKIEKVADDLKTIEELHTKYELQIKDYYIRTLDLSLALRENSRLIELEKRLEREKEEKEKQLEQEQQEQVEVKKEEVVKVVPVIQKKEPVIEEKTEEAVEVSSIYTVGLNVEGTREELDLFCKFLIENKIKYTVTSKPVQKN